MWRNFFLLLIPRIDTEIVPLRIISSHKFLRHFRLVGGRISTLLQTYWNEKFPRNVYSWCRCKWRECLADLSEDIFIVARCGMSKLMNDMLVYTILCQILHGCDKSCNNFARRFVKHFSFFDVSFFFCLVTMEFRSRQAKRNCLISHDWH